MTDLIRAVILCKGFDEPEKERNVFVGFGGMGYQRHKPV